MSVLTILDNGNNGNEKKTIEELYEQHEEKGTVDKFFEELLQSIETKKEVINPDISGLLYVWREGMLRNIKRINKFIPIRKTFKEQMAMNIEDLITYCEMIGIGSYSDPVRTHYNIKIQRKLKQHRLRLREDSNNLNCKLDKDVERITNLVGEVNPDDSADEQCDDDEDGYGKN